MPTIEELQAQLQREIVATAEARNAEAAEVERIAQEKLKLEELERQEKIETLIKRQEAIKAQREAERLLAEREERKRLQKQAEVEAVQNAAIAAQEEKARLLEELQRKIANEEFAKEQHLKKLEDLRKSRPAEKEKDYPIAPVNSQKPGDAVDGTGGVEEYATMSPHLRQLLRRN